MSEPDGGAHLDFLRARHEALKNDRQLDLDVPGYGHRLVLRYGPVPWAVVNRAQPLMARADKDGSSQLFAAADVLVASCREVLVRTPSDELGPVDPSGETVKIEPRLAELLHLDDSSARATLLDLFGNDLAVPVQAGEVLTWSQDSDREVGELVTGE